MDAYVLSVDPTASQETIQHLKDNGFGEVQLMKGSQTMLLYVFVWFFSLIFRSVLGTIRLALFTVRIVPRPYFRKIWFETALGTPKCLTILVDRSLG